MRCRERNWPSAALCAIGLLLSAAAFAADPAPNRWTCATCHTQQTSTQPATSMGRALQPVSSDPLFHTHPKMTVRKGVYTYVVETRGEETTYSVTDGVTTISVPVHWVFGAGSQTFVLERNGHYYESLVSYWRTIDGLDTTVGDQAIHPSTVAEAFGRELAMSEVTLCFGCHSSGSVTHHQLQLDKLTPGITCMHCHVNADEHLQAISHGRVDTVPPKLKQLSPEEVSSFCGQCHRTWETVLRNHWMGQMNVRFQPYRLENSKCFDGSDARISCLACHDPHREVVRDDSAYDPKCLACHSAGAKLSLGMISAHPGATEMKTCPVAKSGCVSCHMPKVPLPGGHDLFTDHDIRIVRANETYPN